MGAFTNFLETAVLNHIGGNTAYTQPTTHVGLFTVMPGENGSGGTECSYTGYARQAASFGAASAGDPSTMANDAELDFGDPDADLTIVGFGLFDASSAGNLLVFQTLGAPVNTQDDVTESITFGVGDLVITLD